MFGKHLSEEHKKKISAALKGKMSGDKHPNFGKTGSLNPNAKRIIIDEDVYGSIEDAAIAFEKHRLTIYYWLKSGKAKYL